MPMVRTRTRMVDAKTAFTTSQGALPLERDVDFRTRLSL